MSNAKALLVGVNKYAKNRQEPQNLTGYLEDLWCAENDAEAFGVVLKELGFETKCLKSPTTDAIKIEFQAYFKDVKKEDVILFFYSGHGVSSNEFNVVMLGSDESEDSYRNGNGGISIGSLLDDITHIGCHIILFFDCCRVRCQREPYHCVVRRIDTRTADRRKTNFCNGSSKGTGNVVKKHMYGIEENTGDATIGTQGTRWVFFSCGPNQYSNECHGFDEEGNLGHGVFTEAILNVVSDYKTRKRYFAFDHSFEDDLQTWMNKITRKKKWSEQTLDTLCLGRVNYQICFATRNADAKVYSLSDEHEKEDLMVLMHQTSTDEFDQICETMLSMENDNDRNQRRAYDHYLQLARRGSGTAMYCVGLCLLVGRGVEINVNQGLRRLEQAGASGCADAYFTLGYLYAMGKMVGQDHVAAYKWFEQGALLCSPASLRSKGFCHLLGRGVVTNEIEAVKCFKLAEKKGDVVAQFYLGVCCANGWGCRKNSRKAVQWWQRASARGDASSLCNLGYCYGNGMGIEVNHEESAKLYEEAAKKGIPQAQFNIGVAYHDGDGVKQDSSNAVKWYMRGAKQGDVESQYNIGVCYEKGDGVEKNMVKAAQWYRKAAEKGDADAQCHLGYCYDMGEGVKKDEAEAARWYLAAAKQGFVVAQFNIGACYADGRGVTQDDARAAEWWLKAAERGDGLARFNIGVCYERGQGVEQDAKEAAKWYLEAAKQGVSQAQYNIANFYHDGLGVKKNVVTAFMWWLRAAVQGDELAQYRVGVCYETGDGVKLDIDEALKWYREAAANECEDAQGALRRITNSEARE